MFYTKKFDCLLTLKEILNVKLKIILVVGGGGWGGIAQSIGVLASHPAAQAFPTLFFLMLLRFIDRTA